MDEHNLGNLDPGLGENSNFASFSFPFLSSKTPSQKKRPSIDACAARLSDSATRSSWSSSTRKMKSGGGSSSRLTESPEKQAICMECGEASEWGEPCDSCAQSSSSRRDTCVMCNDPVNPTQARICTTCRKWVHKSCDGTEVGLLEDFVCTACRASPLVGGDAMLSGPTSLLGGSPDPPSANLNISGRSSPSGEPEPFQDLYFPSTNEDTEMSVPSSPTDSASGRDSPGFYPENTPSSDNDDFKPHRGKSSSRGGKAGKKKPGSRGGSMSASQMKTRSGGQPPSGIFSAVGKAEGRGKRGGQSQSRANKTGNGKGLGSIRGRRATSTRASSSHLIVTGRELDDETMGSGRDYTSGAGTLASSMDSTRSRGDSIQGGGQYVRTPVVASADDAFLDAAPLCLVCGAVGKGEEGSQVTCSSCAHTYHTYCVNLHDKLNTTLVQRGWRCLDCTVCEACGEGGDETKLLLCEECDTAFHIYCLSPPLESIPSGAWRCQYCAKCRRCSIRTTELSREGLCQPCYSLRKCPKCAKLYQLGDSIIRCSTCQRWFHGRCEDLHTQEQLEDACQNRMRCSQCRPHIGSSNLQGENTTQIICDNVALTKSANELLQSKMMPQLFRSNSFLDAYLEEDTIPEEMDFITSGRGRMRGGPGRRVPKLGVGGFYVKIPRHRLATADEDSTPLGEDEKPRLKRPRKPRRSQLEDAYPAAIQEGFFGIRAVDGKTMLDTVMEEPRITVEWTKPPNIDRPTDGSEIGPEATSLTMDMHLNENELEHVIGGNIADIDDFNFDQFEMDFLGEDDDEDTLDDSLNDAMDLAQNDGFSMSRSNSGMTAPTQDSMYGRIGVPPQAQIVQQPAHYGQGAGYGSGIAQSSSTIPSSLSRSSSQMDGSASEKVNQATERWEEDEPLGHRATKAAVLYANVNYPQLKETHPEWSERVKQIHRIWRGLDAESRQEYVSRARENRASRAKVPKQTKKSAPAASAAGEAAVAAHLAAATAAQQQQAAQQHVVQQQMIGQAGPSGMPPNFGQMRHEFKVPTMPGGTPVPGQGPQTGFFDEGGDVQHRLIQPQGVQTPGLPPGTPGAMPLTPQTIVPHPQAPTPQQRAIASLNDQQREQYNLMRTRTADLNKQQEMIEADLGRLRKQKKNLAAKKRQMAKTAEQGAATDGSDLSEQDQAVLDDLNRIIPQRQKDLELCKRESKAHQTAMTDFETKHGLNIAPPPSPISQVPPGTPGVVQPLPGQAPLVMRPQFMPPGYPQQLPIAGLPPQQPGPSRMQLPYPGQLVGGEGGSGGVTPTTPRPGSAASEGAKKGRKRKGQEDFTPQPQGMPLMGHPLAMVPSHPGMFFMRSEVLGGRRYSEMQTDEERGSYECLDDVIHTVCRRIDPPPSMATTDTTLKRILGGVPSDQRMVAGPSGMPPQGGPPLAMLGQLGPAPPGPLAEPPKAKKKRQQQKKTGGVQASEYELMVERVITQLRLCPALPRRQMEPPARNDRQAFGAVLTELPERADKETMVGWELGQLQLSFMDDYYEQWWEDENADAQQLNSLPSMTQLAPGAFLHALSISTRQPDASSIEERVQDAEDSNEDAALNEIPALLGAALLKQAPASKPAAEEAKGEPRCASPILRAVGRLADPPHRPPMDPPRMRFQWAFKKMIEQPDVDVEIPVCAVVKTEEGGIVSLFEQLKEILGTGVEGKCELLDYQLVTPPQSPENDMGREIKREPGVVSPPPPPPQPTLIRCRACELAMQTALVQQTMSQLGLTPSDDGKDDKVSFCSMKCYYDFVAASKVALNPDQLQAAEAHVDDATLAKLRQISAESFAKCIQEGVTRPAPVIPDSFLTSPRDTRYIMDEGKGRENLKPIRVTEMPAFGESPRQEKPVEKTEGRKSDGWMIYDQGTLDSFIRVKLMKQELALTDKLGVARAPAELDNRVCGFCQQRGDGDVAVCGRLLNVDADLWVHVNCALWSSEVYETTSGGLVKVEEALRRAKNVHCNVCGSVGASIQCYKMDCHTNFHLPCARSIQGAKFIKDKTFHCSRHTDTSPEVCVPSLHALRRIYVDRDAENEVIAKVFEVVSDGSPRLSLRLGSITLHAIGQLLPEQLKAFHTANFIYPIGYSIRRLYWSPIDTRTRVPYECKISENNRVPEFSVSVLGRTINAPSATEAWRPFLDEVSALRVQGGDVLRLWPNTIQGETLFGLSEPAVSKVTESLPGVDSLLTYQFRHGGSPLMDLPLAVNPSGCARCEPRFRTLIKHQQRPLIAGTNTRSAPSSERRTRGAQSSATKEIELMRLLQASGVDPSMAMYAQGLSRTELTGGRPQVYSEYQKMRKEWRQLVYLARSKIQGLGLYAKRDLDMGSFIIEYKGELIRSEVCEMREKRYFAQNRGTYMFRIDDEWVIDATMAGGPARYINHSCDPNCSARILEVGNGEKKIIITANRPIKAGEELAYDYQFDLEDDTSKVPCLCGAPNCVKWMN